MILNTGNRTDIPAFFSDWFFNRIQEGFVCVRNPYFPHQVTKYGIITWLKKKKGGFYGNFSRF